MKMMKNKIFICGPMTGLKNFNYQSFDLAAIWLESQGYEVRNPACHPHNWTDYDDYLKASLCMLEMCDQIALLPGWAKSKGAKIEYDRAKKLSIKHDNVLFLGHIQHVLKDIHTAALKNNEGLKNDD